MGRRGLAKSGGKMADNPRSCRSWPASLPPGLVFDIYRKDPTVMLDSAVKALSQILSPPMRSILWRSIGLALVLIVVLAIGLQRLLSWLAGYGEVWLEGLLGPGWHASLEVLAWIISLAAGVGVVFCGVVLLAAGIPLVGRP